jgi:REP element-mobilizing transposase RayT
MDSKKQKFCEFGHLLTRKPMRKPGRDYASVGDYFVTLCLKNRAPILSKVQHNHVVHTEIGDMFSQSWYYLPQKFPYIKLHSFIVMPDHLHGIIEIFDPANQDTISKMLASYKSWTTHEYTKGVRGKNWPPFQKKLWQTSFWDTILEGPSAFKNCTEYIETNPLRW